MFAQSRTAYFPRSSSWMRIFSRNVIKIFYRVTPKSLLASNKRVVDFILIWSHQTGYKFEGINTFLFKLSDSEKMPTIKVIVGLNYYSLIINI